jgi:hypothetical protein
MAWFKVDDGFANSKPVLRIPRRYRAAAIGLWTLAGTWSAKELTDGFVPEYTLEDFCATPALATQLVKAELWEESSSGWQFLGWSKYQFTKAKVLEHREAEAEKKRKWREAKAAASDLRESKLSTGDDRVDTSGSPVGTSRVSTSTRPDQTRPVPSSLNTSGGDVTNHDAGDAEKPPRYCPRHPNGTAGDCGPCGTARHRLEAWEAHRKAAEAESARKARTSAAIDRAAGIRMCDLCDSDGYIGTRVCDHVDRTNQPARAAALAAIRKEAQ